MSPSMPPTVEHIHGETIWIALRSRSADWSWITPDEAVTLGKMWMKKYAPEEAFAFSAAKTTQSLLPTTEEHIHGGAVWIALRARGADWSWITPDEAVALGKIWVKKYAPKEVLVFAAAETTQPVPPIAKGPIEPIKAVTIAPRHEAIPA